MCKAFYRFAGWRTMSECRRRGTWGRFAPQCQRTKWATHGTRVWRAVFPPLFRRVRGRARPWTKLRRLVDEPVVGETIERRTPWGGMHDPGGTCAVGTGLGLGRGVGTLRGFRGRPERKTRGPAPKTKGKKEAFSLWRRAAERKCAYHRLPGSPPPSSGCVLCRSRVFAHWPWRVVVAGLFGTETTTPPCLGATLASTWPARLGAAWPCWPPSLFLWRWRKSPVRRRPRWHSLFTFTQMPC